MAKRVGIIGAAGYTGAELLRFIHAHPHLELSYVAARERVGQRLEQAVPSTAGVSGFGDLVLEAFDPERAHELASRCEVMFTALPHEASEKAAGALLSAGLVVVDLSAAFRLKDTSAYRQWYGEPAEHALLERAVYGMPELHRSELAGTDLIAVPGCYPTSAILALAPLLAANLVESDGIIVDAKSGVSGAGRTPGPSSHFSETAEGIRPYKVAGAHRHTPEIEQELSLVAGRPVRVLFTPHLVPMIRGILSIGYARAKPGTTAARCVEAAKQFHHEGLVTVLPEGRLPDTLFVRGSARAHIAYALDERTGYVLAMGAIDNLAKGASAQAIQALNVRMGWPDALGLPQIGLFP